jgi:hypothetical protein
MGSGTKVAVTNIFAHKEMYLTKKILALKPGSSLYRI